MAPTATEKVAFHATGSSDGYECRVGSAAFAPCSSPWSFEVGDPGEYSGQVRAVGEGGADPTPASFNFRSAPPVERCGRVGRDETWSTADISGVVITCSLEIPAGVKLTIRPGVFVKSEGGIVIVDGGALEAEGTAAQPVVFTTIADDTVGGDSGASVPANSPEENIELGGVGTVDLDHAILRDAGSRALQLDGSCSGSGPACENDTEDKVTVTNTELEGPLRTGWVDLSGFATTGADANRFTGPAPGRAIQFVDDEFRGQTLTLTPQLGATAWGWSGGPEYLRVSAGGKLRLAAGAYMKVPVIVDGGALEAEGTAAQPVVFTTIADDTVGGDSNGDGASTAPHEGEAAGIRFDAGSSEPQPSNLGFVEIRYAEAALEVAGENQVAVRGIFRHDQTGIEACGWTESCSVDAAYVYWGSAEGPFPHSHPALACGAVTTSPYLSTEAGATAGAEPLGTPECHGAVSPLEQFNASQAAAGKRIGEEAIRCDEGFEEACQIIHLYEQCLGAATQLAQSNAPDIPFTQPDDVAGAAGDFLQESEHAVVSSLGQLLSFASEAHEAYHAISTISTAYSSCG
ncbi:MAG TPA: hypothetical protein VHA80_01050 [Solirubrobacterales bacterium]|nr:hypothetical protein [Solirubrobacterales bacterium]